MLVSVSSMRRGRSTQYFAAIIIDSDCKVQVVGFQEQQLRKLTMICEVNKSVNLRNCQIKKLKYGEKIPQILHAYDNPLRIDGLVWSANHEKS